ncbi:MAG: DegT/DnrJ/EryC1/StrS family aminotransferase [Akkermansiaceae bacterium]|nr:DegT/DnrJ/EryC1/StrS family aminotransferase [Akkermansiaceae bacterium]MCP5545704.1 DegT/DnrJ/EryC1/StrS family aminotransferase [Akkermansiaceae bacterium]
MIPFLDMQDRHSPRRGEYLRALERVLDSGTYAGGPEVERFETAFAAACGTTEAIGVGSGTEALWLALAALGIGPGDEVVTVPMTFAATVESICMTGATPVFVDIDERTRTMDPASLERALTPRTKAVVPVHLFGRIADMDAILEIADRRGIPVIEDAAQAHGAERAGRRAGALGLAGCFSFYPSKNLGAMGDAGAVTTNDPELARRIRALREHGQERRHVHRWIGWNARMDAMQAAVLEIGLRDLDAGNRRRRELARRYEAALRPIPGIDPPEDPGDGSHVYHLYAVRAADRGALCAALDAASIGYGIHYPVPVHLQPAYEHLGHRAGDFPVAERCAREFLSLPLHPGLADSDIDRIVDVLAAASLPLVGS